MSIGPKKKALVHIAKEDLHLDEESYRQILKSVAGVESSTQLSQEGFQRVMGRFQEMGFRGLLPHPYRPVPKGRLIPLDSPHGLEAITRKSAELHHVSAGESELGRGALSCLLSAYCQEIQPPDET